MTDYYYSVNIGFGIPFTYKVEPAQERDEKEDEVILIGKKKLNESES
jgi:hypothetical protein